MKRFLLSAWIILCVLSSKAQEGRERKFSLPASLSSADYLAGKIIFKMKQGAVSQNRTSNEGNIVNLKSATILNIKGKFPQMVLKNQASTLKQSDEYGLNRIYELSFSEGDIEKAINELLANDDIEYAEPVYIYHTSYLPSDPAYRNNLMSYLDQVKAPEAWNLVRNSSSPVILAIVDSGSDLDHPDLAANIYVNAADPVNGRDDDGDGFQDNYYGWDFVGASETNGQADNNPNVINSNNDHGVHVSGIASAVSDNNTGVASVAFNTAKLMIVKAGPDDNGTLIVRGYEGIKYAADHGAQIINCSWGGEGQSSFGQDIVNYAISKGCLIVAAAGNDGVSSPQYPAAYQGVMAVANVGSSDVLNPSSNYGYYVSICAPGTGIYSTTFNNVYGIKSGTSMASPVVASAAALVKAYLPHLSMSQVGEQLRATSDNIDQINPDYAKKLGKGRLNVYRALTESPPSIKKQAIALQDKANGIIPAGDTLTIYVDLKNFLSPVTNLQITLSSNDPNVTVTKSQSTVPFIGTLATQTAAGPFKVYIKPGTPDNYNVEFQLKYSANNNSYTDFESFVVAVNRDYLNISTDVIATTVTSVGKIGYLEAGLSTGTQGFQYKGEQLLYESALMIGNSPSRVSDNARYSVNNSNDNFVRKVRVQGHQESGFFEAKAEFDDSNSATPLNVYVKQRSYILKAPQNQKYLITEYEVINNTSSPLNNIFIGLFNDWDINGGSTNVTGYDSDSRLAYVYDKTDANSSYAGVRLLNAGSPAYYPLSNRLSGNILANDDFTKEEKFETLSSGVKSTGLGAAYPNGLDVSFVSGYGPYTIPANGSVKAAFAFIGGDHLEDLKASANDAQNNYNQLFSNVPEQEIAGLTITSYPNPVSVNDTERLILSLPEDGKLKLSLYNVIGEKVMDIKDEMFSKGAHVVAVEGVNELSSGVYYYRAEINGNVKSHKITVLR